MAKSNAGVANNSLDAQARATQFMRSALDILGETGRTEFTVLEVVERSKTSLRAFYQHFATKDELVLAFYHDRLAETMPDDYGRVLTPLHALIVDIVERGMADGTFAPGLDVEATAALVMQTIFGALRLRALGPGLELTPIGSERIYSFCLRALEN